MTEEQVRFTAFVKAHTPDLLKLFDFDKREIKAAEVEQYLKTASSGEKQVARFILGLWLGNNEYDFDLFDAVGTLSDNNVNVIREWLADPFWP